MKRKKCYDGYYFVGCAAAMMIVLWDLLQLGWIECKECELKMIEKRKRRGCLFSRFRMFNLHVVQIAKAENNCLSITELKSRTSGGADHLQKQKIIAPPYVNDPITGAFLYKKEKKKKREMQTSKFTVNLTCNSYIDVITQ